MNDIKSNKKDENVKPKKKEIVPGVVYMSYIPPFMTVKKVRQLLNEYGTVGRIFLQPDKKKQGKVSKFFTEGWIEFSDKRVAKRVANHLNRQQIGGKRRSPYYDSLWSLKYLKKFRWTHLNERLAYEKASRDQRVKIEISQAKRETDYIVQTTEKSRALTKRKKRNAEMADLDSELPSVKIPKQQPTDDEVCTKRTGSQNKNSNLLLSNIFGNKKL